MCVYGEGCAICWCRAGRVGFRAQIFCVCVRRANFSNKFIGTPRGFPNRVLYIKDTRHSKLFRGRWCPQTTTKIKRHHFADNLG